MRIDSSVLHPLALAAVIALSCVAGPATAGDRYREKVHADSFGNLVIYSAAGYKRIVVGAGYLAPEFNATLGDDRPGIVNYEEGHSYRGRIRCNRKPVLLHGRSYMYGLPDNVVPTPAGTCD